LTVATKSLAAAPVRACVNDPETFPIFSKLEALTLETIGASCTIRDAVAETAVELASPAKVAPMPFVAHRYKR